MRTFFTLFLLFIASNSYVISQTYDPNPISKEKTISIFDLSTYKDKVAISVFQGIQIQVYIFKDNKWSPLPNKVIQNGIERDLINTSQYIKHNIYSNSGIEFDSKGSIWINCFDGIYQFDTTLNQWSYYTLPNINKDFTRFKYIRIDSLDNIWTIVDVYRGNSTILGDSTNIGDTNFVHYTTTLFKFREGQFEEIHLDSNSYPLNFVFNYPSYSVINNTPLNDGIILRNLNSEKWKDLIHVKSDGSVIDYELPTTDLDVYEPVEKYTHYLFNDSKNHLWALLYLVTQDTAFDKVDYCCSGLARLENSKWYRYNHLENLMPNVKVLKDSLVKYYSPQFVTELQNDEFLFVMREDYYNKGANPYLYKLTSDDKLIRAFWKQYLEQAIVFRSDSVRITNQTMKYVIETFKNETNLDKQLIPLYGMKSDAGGNLWIWGSQFVIKAPINATTSVSESIKKPTVIYPNPGNKSIRLGNITNDITKIEILNITGTVVKSIVGISEIPVNDLSNGIYFVKIYSTDGKLEVVKFVKD